ncbi:MAG TPA: NADPH-dependent 7-cyano-7-deazaguanine reductase QueF [Spongiibacteraceae bacterium]|nr:NADPH-dependent 7-cyano-7-deazaguanine reductase QueF [Spongiibacteraceae bacterium]
MAEHELPLGRAVTYDAAYDPDLLYPIARAVDRRAGADGVQLPMHGWDVWNAYELSWLDAGGKPVVAWGEFWVSAMSPNIVESKSFKLYLNSLNQHRFATITVVQETLERDLARCIGARVQVNIHLPTDWGALTPSAPAGRCLDDLPLLVEHYQPAPQLLKRSEKVVEERLYSRLLRSCCPVTGQPDWATLQVDYRGPEIDDVGLLAYIISFRQHQDFHEQCVERIFRDIQQFCSPERLAVYGRYLRRGGLDINPYRSTGTERPPSLRCRRQ